MDRHPFHVEAVAAYEAAREKGTVHNVIILSETHRILCRSVGLQGAGAALRAILADDEMSPVSPETVTRALELAEGEKLSTNDALIAAHALEEGMELLTFDADFRRVPGLRRFR